MPHKLTNLFPLVLFAVMAVVWTWPLASRFHDHIPGLPGDNFSFLWNLWWMRKALSAPDLSFFQSAYLFSPFGVDLVNHPHTALQGLISATALSRLSIVQAENLYIIGSVFLNAAAAYALAFDLTRRRTPAVLAGLAFGGSPYVAAHLLGHFDLLTAWVFPLFALFFRRALLTGGKAAALVCGVCLSVAAYSAYYHVVYLALFAATYFGAWWAPLTVGLERRADTRRGLSLRLILIGSIALVAFVIIFVRLTGGTVLQVGGREISMRGVENPLLVFWVLAIAWLLMRWRIVVARDRTEPDVFWRGVQALTITAATFAVLCAPLIAQAARLLLSGRYITQEYYWRSAPRGVDVAALIIGNPFHPLVGSAVSGLYGALGIDRIEAVGWIGIVPLIVLLRDRGRWLDGGEARRWKIVLTVFLIWALGPFLTIAGVNLGLPLPQTLARFLPIVENARMPGRAMVGAYLALGILMALRLAARDAGPVLSDRPRLALILLLAFDYLHAPIPLTALDRPAVYQHLAAIDDGAPVIEVPFGIGDGLSSGTGAQDRRILYYATIHGHPLIGGYIGRMPPGVAAAYERTPVIGNLLRLSHGEEPLRDQGAARVPFRYLVLNTATASVDSIVYLRTTLDMDLIAAGAGRELYAVQGVRPTDLTARK